MALETLTGNDRAHIVDIGRTAFYDGPSRGGDDPRALKAVIGEHDESPETPFVVTQKLGELADFHIAQASGLYESSFPAAA